MERLTSKRDWVEAGKDLSNEWGYSHIWRRLKQIEDILGDAYNLDRLRELVEADKEGRCVVLPVKIGDQVYTVFPLSFKREAKLFRPPKEKKTRHLENRRRKKRKREKQNGAGHRQGHV